MNQPTDEARVANLKRVTREHIEHQLTVNESQGVKTTTKVWNEYGLVTFAISIPIPDNLKGASDKEKGAYCAEVIRSTVNTW